MSDDFYRLLDWIVNTRILYTKYYTRVLRIERTIYIASSLLTCSGVWGFLNSDYCPKWLASTIVFIGQILTIAYPHLPYTKRRYAIEYMLDKFRELETQVESAWRHGCADPEGELERLRNTFDRIGREYLGGEEISFSKSLIDRTDIEKRAEMHVRFGVDPHDYKYAKTGKPIRRNAAHQR